ncbi:hypothetical protein AVEN_256735-1, partial [Araneus ventricosus]
MDRAALNMIESDAIANHLLLKIMESNETSTAVTSTSSSLMSTILTSTITSCDCGIGGSCQLDSSGDKICNCFSGYARYKGYCYDCDCGPYGTCIIDAGIKRCTCDFNYAEKNGKCE